MANEQLMPAPLTDLPCSYKRRTDGPMPLGATSTTLMSLRKSTPSLFMTPSRKPCERPSVEPGFMAARMRGYSFACAASEMSRMTRSESATTSNTSPSVPSLAEKPVASASAHEGDPLRRPMATGMLRPAVAIESLRFCACAGACEPQPMTPIFLMPSNAAGRPVSLSWPPRTMYSSCPANVTSSFWKALVLKSRCTAETTCSAPREGRPAATGTRRPEAAREATFTPAALLRMVCIVAGLR
mmetsp:Transcript_9514/g.28871  ORF Transcript_9514/g.28871 Transcript_9514/m.28871 type:complete len:242 (+) Transcript_9514:1365-2090(+)